MMFNNDKLFLSILLYEIESFYLFRSPEKFHLGRGIVLGYFILKFITWGSFEPETTLHSKNRPSSYFMILKKFLPLTFEHFLLKS